MSALSCPNCGTALRIVTDDPTLAKTMMQQTGFRAIPIEEAEEKARSGQFRVSTYDSVTGEACPSCNAFSHPVCYDDTFGKKALSLSLVVTLATKTNAN